MATPVASSRAVGAAAPDIKINRVAAENFNGNIAGQIARKPMSIRGD
jgi:hypothetical protein